MKSDVKAWLTIGRTTNSEKTAEGGFKVILAVELPGLKISLINIYSLGP